MRWAPEGLLHTKGFQDPFTEVDEVVEDEPKAADNDDDEVASLGHPSGVSSARLSNDS